LDGCPKAVGMMMVLRSMAPQLMAVDELGTEEDVKALFSVIRSGCKMIATIHGEGLEDLKTKTFMKEVMRERIFERYVVILEDRTMQVYNEEFCEC